MGYGKWTFNDTKANNLPSLHALTGSCVFYSLFTSICFQEMYLYFRSIFCSIHVYFTVIFILKWAQTQLVVNLKNNGGQIFTETIYSNASEDFVNIEYQTSDGSAVSHLIDYRNVSFIFINVQNSLTISSILLSSQDIQIFRVLMLGEQENEEPTYHALCLVLSFNVNEIISSDAISKLRQVSYPFSF